MIDKVREYIQFHHMIEKGSKIVMGVSGGADSVAMLLLLSLFKEEYDLLLWAVHVNHGIRKESGQDAEYVRQLCEARGIPFYLYEADIPELARQQRRTEEEMGREYRYQCFGEVMRLVSADRLAVAHHMGDQAETVLFHMVRGTDLPGLMGIRPVQERILKKTSFTEKKAADTGLEDGQNIKIIRPLLCCEKKELTDWLVSQGVTWQEDITNENNVYARNKLRNQVMPLLKEINTGAVSHIAGLADTMTEYEVFFRHAVEGYMTENVRIIKKARDSGDIVCEANREQLLSRDRILAKAVIYEMLAQVCGEKKDLTKEHVQSIYELLAGQSGKKVILPYETEALILYEKLQIRKCLEQDTALQWCEKVLMPAHRMDQPGEDLHLEAANGPQASQQFAELPALGEDLGHLPDNGSMQQVILLPSGGSVLLEWFEVSGMSVEEREKLSFTARNFKNNYTKFFGCDTIKDTLYVRTVRGDDYIVINEQGGRKKLSRYFIDAKIPPDQRRCAIVLAMAREVLWIIGGRRCERFKIKDDTRYILKVTYEGESNEGSD